MSTNLSTYTWKMAMEELTQTIEVIENKGMKQKDVKKAVGIVELYKEEIVNSWQMYFSK